MGSDWLAALLAAHQKLHLKIVVSYPCFYPGIALVTLTHGVLRHGNQANDPQQDSCHTLDNHSLAGQWHIKLPHIDVCGNSGK